MHESGNPSTDPRFVRLWLAFAVSTFGTWIAFDAFPLVAVLALHSPPFEVSLLAAAGLAVGAVVAVPFGPAVERRRKRRVMVAADVVRFLVLATIPLAWGFGALSFPQLLVAAVVVGAADVAFRSASGAHLKNLVARHHLLPANARFESTTWTATMLGPPLGGALVAVCGPVVTVAVDAVSYLLSASGVRSIPGDEPAPPVRTSTARWRHDVGEGWRFLLRRPYLRALLLNTALVNGLILATAPLLAVLMLGRLHVAPWQYGLAFATPCVGGLIGSRLARRMTVRWGQERVLRRAGTARACWSVALAVVPGGWGGWAAVGVVALVQFGLVTSCAVFNPVSATLRLERTPDDRLARTLAAWTVTTKLSTAVLTAGWGLLAAVVGVRPAIALAGGALLLTPLLLPSRDEATAPTRDGELVAA